MNIFCYRGLLSCVRHCADLVTSTERQEPIQKCFRSLEYIFKFVIQSRSLFSRATGGKINIKNKLYNMQNVNFLQTNRFLPLQKIIVIVIFRTK